jgi:curved DNA-binding protein CbpA
MDPRTRMRVEIETLHELLPEVDYYRLLQVEQDGSGSDIDRAFRGESRRLHPDRCAALGDGELSGKANDVYRRLNEAYRALKDPELRARYDEELRAGARRASDTARADADRDRSQAQGPEAAATNPKSEKYWAMALRDWHQGNFKGCTMNIQFALSFEPENAVFKEWLEKARLAAEEKSKENFNPYKLRIV